MTNYRIDKDRTLRDSRGNRVGDVDYWNRVHDGYRDRGHVDANDRYTDEYGRDQGWALPDYGGSDGGGGLALLLVMGFVALVVWLISVLGEALGSSKSRPARAHITSPAHPVVTPRPSIHAPRAKSAVPPRPPAGSRARPLSSRTRAGVRPTPINPSKPHAYGKPLPQRSTRSH